MFGVVPKTLWQRRIPADDRNRIPLGMRCLLVEHEAGLVLIDTGSGNKEDGKFKDIYCIVNEAPEAEPDGSRRTMLEAGLRQLAEGGLSGQAVHHAAGTAAVSRGQSGGDDALYHHRPATGRPEKMIRPIRQFII